MGRFTFCVVRFGLLLLACSASEELRDHSTGIQYHPLATRASVDDEVDLYQASSQRAPDAQQPTTADKNESTRQIPGTEAGLSSHRGDSTQARDLEAAQTEHDTGSSRMTTSGTMDEGSQGDKSSKEEEDWTSEVEGDRTPKDEGDMASEAGEDRASENGSDRTPKDEGDMASEAGEDGSPKDEGDRTPKDGGNKASKEEEDGTVENGGVIKTNELEDPNSSPDGADPLAVWEKEEPGQPLSKSPHDPKPGPSASPEDVWHDMHSGGSVVRPDPRPQPSGDRQASSGETTVPRWQEEEEGGDTSEPRAGGTPTVRGRHPKDKRLRAEDIRNAQWDFTSFLAVMIPIALVLLVVCRLLCPAVLATLCTLSASLCPSIACLCIFAHPPGPRRHAKTDQRQSSFRTGSLGASSLGAGAQLHTRMRGGPGMGEDQEDDLWGDDWDEEEADAGAASPSVAGLGVRPPAASVSPSARLTLGQRRNGGASSAAGSERASSTGQASASPRLVALDGAAVGVSANGWDDMGSELGLDDDNDDESGVAAAGMDVDRPARPAPSMGTVNALPGAAAATVGGDDELGEVWSDNDDW